MGKIISGENIKSKVRGVHVKRSDFMYNFTCLRTSPVSEDTKFASKQTIRVANTSGFELMAPLDAVHQSLSPIPAGVVLAGGTAVHWTACGGKAGPLR